MSSKFETGIVYKLRIWRQDKSDEIQVGQMVGHYLQLLLCTHNITCKNVSYTHRIAQVKLPQLKRRTLKELHKTV